MTGKALQSDYRTTLKAFHAFVDWTHTTAEGLEASVDLGALGIWLGMADIYEGLSFPPAPPLGGD